MAIKYQVLYKDFFQNQCTVNISTDAYTGDPISVRGVGTKACEIVRDCDDDPYATIINTKANINIYQSEDYDVDILELQIAQDKQFTVQVIIAGVTEFIGFLIPDGIQQTFQAAPYEINLTATDGIALLDTTNYTPGTIAGNRCVLLFLKDILFSPKHLGLILPIRWANTLTNDAFPLEADVFSGSVRWANRGEGFTDYQGNYKTCLYILENLLKCMECRIVQVSGRWVIWRINDVVTGEFHMYETPAVLAGLVVNDIGLINVNKTFGDTNRKPIMEDAVLTVLPGLKTVKTTYSQDERDNVLPNGNMDIYIAEAGAPLYWGFNTGTTATTEQYNSLSNSTGNSVKITNLAGQPTATFQLSTGELPIDTDVLYTYINFGFKFTIISGATVDSNGIIQWASTNNSIIVRYNDGATLWYLNENGFWVKTVTTIDINPANIKLSDVVQIDFNAKQNIIMPLPATVPIGRTTTPSLYVGFFIPAGRVIAFDDIYINVEANSDVYEATIPTTTNTASVDYELNISSAHSGFYVSNLMTDFSQSGLEKFYSDAHLTGATLTEMASHSIMRSRYASSLVFEGSIYGDNYKYDEIYSIPQFPGRKFLPLRSTWNTETNVTNLTMCEIRNDGTGIFTNHYGSNDSTTLSN